MVDSSKRFKIDKHHQSHQISKLDRLSALPDAILLHIMSFIGTVEVVKTSSFSKRWQFLWTNISKIVLSHDFSAENADDEAEDSCGFVDWVGKLLLMCGENNLAMFDVSFKFFEFLTPKVNNWLQFAVKNKVKVVKLEFFYECGDTYKLPQLFYSHPYLTSLSLENCNVVAPIGEVKWLSLKQLSLDMVHLSEFEKILSGCPVLEVLELYRGNDYYCPLPQVLYSHSYLTKLTLTGCAVAPLGQVKWGSLKTLSLQEVA